MSIPNTTIWLASRMRNTATRPIRSDNSPQNRRPTPLQSELTAIKVAPYSASIAGSRPGSDSPHTSCSSSDWKLMTEMPAAILQKKTIHMIVNERVRRYGMIASRSSPPGGRGAACAAAVDASGAGGSLRNRLQGTRMQAKMMPSQMKTCSSSCPVRTTSSGASTLLSSRAPTPKPITTIPVTSPLRSGNHLATVATGVT